MPQLVKIDVKLGYHDLDDHAHLTCQIAEILSLWAQAEDEIAIIFGFAMLTQPAIAAAVLGCTANLATRLTMVQTAIELGVSVGSAKDFEKSVVPRIRKAAKRRNRVAHAIWTTHKSYPNDIIRLTGLTSPTLDSERWSVRDFLELKLAMATLQLQLREFAQTLPAARDEATRTGEQSYWKVAPPDVPTRDDPDPLGPVRQE